MFMKNFIKIATLASFTLLTIFSCNNSSENNLKEKQFLCCGENPFSDLNTTSNFNVSKITTPNGDAINDFLVIKDIQHYPANKVSIYDLEDNLVYDNNYDNLYNVFTGVNQFTEKELESNTYKYKIDSGAGDIQYGYFCLIREASEVEGVDLSECYFDDPIL